MVERLRATPPPLPKRPSHLPVREAKYDPALVRDISIKVYKARLVQESGEGAVERMIAKDKDNGEKLAGRSFQYDTLTRCYLEVFGVPTTPAAS